MPASASCPAGAASAWNRSPKRSASAPSMRPTRSDMKSLPNDDRGLPPGPALGDDTGTRTKAKPSGRISMNFRRHFCVLAAAAAVLFVAGATPGDAAPRGVRIAKQFGISYLPLTVMEEKKLLEAEGKKQGLDLSTEWLQFTGGPPMNEALVSGNLDFASGGVGPLVTIWARTQNNIKVKGIASLNSMPLYLNTITPNVKTIKDFTEKDRIALPAVRVSIQAVVLQMAAEKEFGAGQEHKLDSLTVSLSHPDGLAQMMSGKSEITGHF